MVKSIPYLPERLKNHTLWRRTYIAYINESPPPRGGNNHLCHFLLDVLPPSGVCQFFRLVHSLRKEITDVIFETTEATLRPVLSSFEATTEVAF